MNVTNLDSLYRPKSIAVVGASNTPGKIGFTVVDNLLKSGYEGKIFPINPKDPEVQGLKAYASVLAVPEAIDAAVIVVPASMAEQVTEDCGKKGVKALIVIASGFSEVGNRELEDRVVAIAKRYNMRILGPNIVGTLSNSDKMNASFAPFLPFAGKAALISQSGALLIAIDASTYIRGIG
ncbi:MAG TPA: CoA-binding protein, partial [Anaerolineaceae bacterium]|nr:CoA-binding protein [Anaerolineaceae bacterium]